MTELIKIEKYNEAIELGNLNEPFINMSKLFCMSKLKMHHDILACIDNMKLDEGARQDYKMVALLGLYKQNPSKYEKQIKQQYIPGFKINTIFSKPNYLAHSPYVSKYLDDTTGYLSLCEYNGIKKYR